MNSFVLKDVQLQYASLARPNTEGEYASGKFEVRVIMNKEQVQTLKGFGLSRLVSFRKEEDGSYLSLIHISEPTRP